MVTLRVGRATQTVRGGVRRDGHGGWHTGAMPRTASASLLLSVLLTAGCASLTTTHGTAQPRAAVPPASSAAAGSNGTGRLLAVHDPGTVTYSITVKTCHVLSGPRPDPACTPGSFDPAVTQADLATTICTSGYTANVRPPSSATDKAKKALYTAYGIPTGTVSELDHLVSLELGGSNDVANLWPEVGKVPNPKDSIENALHKAVCAGKVTLSAAQQAIAGNWQTAEAVLGVS